MRKFEYVDRTFSHIPYMDRSRADLLRSIIHQERARRILEIGFYQGKSSLYIGAILEDLGEGHLVTIDKRSALKHAPNIEELLRQAGLGHRVFPRPTERSYTWEMQRMINAPERPQFDLCYFDGGHQWDRTGFGVLLVDMLLRPGGLLILDDMNWAMARSRYHQDHPASMAGYAKDEREAQTVRLAWSTILPHLGYSHEREYPAIDWGVARKGSGNVSQASRS